MRYTIPNQTKKQHCNHLTCILTFIYVLQLSFTYITLAPALAALSFAERTDQIARVHDTTQYVEKYSIYRVSCV